MNISIILLTAPSVEDLIRSLAVVQIMSFTVSSIVNEGAIGECWVKLEQGFQLGFLHCTSC